MQYCSSIWDPNEKGDVTTLEKVQCRAACFVKNDYRRESSVSEMIKDLMSRLTLLYKKVHGLVDVDPSKVVNSGRETRRSTSQHRFRNITANKTCYRSSFLPRTVPEWNKLPDHLRSAHSVETFRTQLAQEIDIAALISSRNYYLLRLR